MTAKEFKDRVAILDDEDNEEIDQLCIKWLAHLAGDYGKEGQVAKVLLQQVKILLEM